AAQQLPAHGRADLGADGLRDGDPVGGAQGGACRADGGRAARRCQRLAALLERSGARHPPVAHRRHHDDLDRVAQGVRHRAHDGHGVPGYRRHREGDGHAAAEVRDRSFERVRGDPVPARAADRHLQRPTDSEAEGDPMTTTTGVSANPALEEKDVKASLRRTKQRLTSRGATIAALVIAVIWTIPTIGLFITSIRPRDEIIRTGWWEIFIRPEVTLENYENVLFGADSLLQPFINSIAISLPATVFPLVIATLAAYAFAWMEFKGRDVLFVLVFALQIVPIQMALVPLLSLFTRGLQIGGITFYEGLRGAGDYSQVWIAHTIFALPLAIFLLHNFIAEIPNEVIEAARVDGASHGQIFFRIVLPLSLPAIAAFAIFQFLWVWNDLLVALIFASGKAAPITRALAELTGEFGRNWHLLPAGAFISIIVPLIVFFALQRYF